MKFVAMVLCRNLGEGRGSEGKSQGTHPSCHVSKPYPINCYHISSRLPTVHVCMCAVLTCHNDIMLTWVAGLVL